MFRGKEFLLYQGDDPARNRYLLSYPSSHDLDLGQDEEHLWRTEESLQFVVESQDHLAEPSTAIKFKSRTEQKWVVLLNIIILIIAFISSPSTNEVPGGCDIKQSLLSNLTAPLSALDDLGDVYFAMS